VIEVIDLTRDDDGDNEGDDGNHTGVSWLRYTRRAQHRVTLFDRPFPGRQPTPFTVLLAKLTGTHSRQPYNIIYSSHT
jgi:hypothetical protein